MVVDDIVINKCASIERCLNRIHEVVQADPEVILSDLTKQDAVMLNLQRACEVLLDLATHLIRAHRLGVPRSSRETLDLLANAGYIDADLSGRLKKMVGFRNLAVHEYQTLDLQIVTSIIKDRLGDFREFVAVIKKL